VYRYGTAKPLLTMERFHIRPAFKVRVTSHHPLGICLLMFGRPNSITSVLLSPTETRTKDRHRLKPRLHNLLTATLQVGVWLICIAENEGSICDCLLVGGFGMCLVGLGSFTLAKNQSQLSATTTIDIHSPSARGKQCNILTDVLKRW
jgi:hypothetical protein